MARKDLSKVLCERERRRSNMKSKQKNKGEVGIVGWPFRGESTSPFPYKEGMKVSYDSHGDRKEFNENLNALWGLLRKSIGKKWDDVYSDICSSFDKRKVINQHILEHLMGNVETNTLMQNGRVCFVNEGAGDIERIDTSVSEYYVHPVSKILLPTNSKSVLREKVASMVATREAEKLKHLRLLDRFDNKNGSGARYAINIKDVWYEISVVERPKPIRIHGALPNGQVESYVHYPEVNDLSIYGAKVIPPELDSDKFYVCRKQQLNSKRLKDLKLR